MFIGILAMIAAFLIGTIGKNSLLSVNAQISGFSKTYSFSLSDLSMEANKFEKLLHSLINESWTISMTPKESIKFVPFSKLDDLEESRSILYKNLKYYDTIYVTSKYNTIYNLPMYEGRWFSNEDTFDRFEVVINKEAMGVFKEEYIAMSENNSLSLLPLNKVGVVNDGKNWPVLYVNIEPVIRNTTLFENSDMGTIYWHTKKNISMNNLQSIVEDKIYDSIGGRVESVARVDNTDNYTAVVDLLQLGLLLSSGLLLFVSILGQINIGLASLEYRTHELLIRRALGASKWNIGFQVLGSIIFLSIFVCLLALFLSVILVNSVILFLPKDSPISPPQYPYGLAFSVIIVSVITAILGGLIPAIKASRLEPALALR